ncbi:hypothetical protein OHB12_33165 [Nocardia sp. NBC_01730]|uniref:hypothetical protein n=1 Tax=Nocardia sp. NBC_01730 TaxID=2975998 RepID=UPI002E138C23|nr:hypothetical protein OHB12_33165 [Nocardia sp. NBC_01730]
MSTAYFACATEMPEFDAISAALKGNPEMEAIRYEMFDSYTELMAATLQPHDRSASAALRRRTGCGRGDCRRVEPRAATAADAITAPTDLIVGTVDTRTDR